MRRFTTLPVLLLGGVFLAACGGGEQSDADAAGSGEMAAASSDALECFLNNATMAEAQERPSPLLDLELSVGGNDALLCYGAPSARGRVVMGEVVPWGEPWRLGANEATAIHLSGPATIGGVELEPGSYSLYAVPGQEEWQFFINSNAERWGIPINDAVRSTELGSFTAEPEEIEEYVETLRYRFEPNTERTMGDVVVEWENTQVRFHVHPGM